MVVSKCPCLTLSAAMSCLEAKISLVPSIVPHSTFNLIVPCNTHPNRQSHKTTKIHTLTSLTDELFFFKIAQKQWNIVKTVTHKSMHPVKMARPLRDPCEWETFLCLVWMDGRAGAVVV